MLKLKVNCDSGKDIIYVHVYDSEGVKQQGVRVSCMGNCGTYNVLTLKAKTEKDQYLIELHGMAI